MGGGHNEGPTLFIKLGANLKGFFILTTNELELHNITSGIGLEIQRLLLKAFFTYCC